MSGTINQISQFRAKNEAAYAFIRELLVQSVRADKIEREATENVLNYLIAEGKGRGYEAVDLNEIFRFVLYGPCVLVIPRRRFGLNDFVVLKNFHPEAQLHSKLIELEQKSFEVHEQVYLPEYLKRCFRRGLHREHF